MNKNIALAALLLVVLAALVFVATNRGPSLEHTRTTADEAAEAGAAERTDVLQQASEAAARVSVDTAALDAPALDPRDEGSARVSLTIRTTDTQGAPVPNAVVVAQGLDEYARLGVSDAAGSLVAEVPEWATRVMAQEGSRRSPFVGIAHFVHPTAPAAMDEAAPAAGDAATATATADVMHEITLALRPTISARVRVTDRESGQPLEGLRVFAIEINGGVSSLPSTVISGEAPMLELGVTDHDGWAETSGMVAMRSYLFAAAGRGYAVTDCPGSVRGGPDGMRVAEPGVVVELVADRVVGALVQLVDATTEQAPQLDWRDARSAISNPLPAALPPVRWVSDWLTLQLLGFPAESLSVTSAGSYSFAFAPIAPIAEALLVSVEMKFPGHLPTRSTLTFDALPFDGVINTVRLEPDGRGIGRLDFTWPQSWLSPGTFQVSGSQGPAIACRLQPLDAGTSGKAAITRRLLPTSNTTSSIHGIPCGRYRMTLTPAQSKPLAWRSETSALDEPGILNIGVDANRVEVLDAGQGTFELRLSDDAGATFAGALEVSLMQRLPNSGDTFSAIVVRFSNAPYVVAPVPAGRWFVRIDQPVQQYDALTPGAIGEVDIVEGERTDLAATLARE